MELPEHLETVTTPSDLAQFTLALRDDLLANEPQWENPTLERFLGAFAAWCIDMPGFFAKRGEPQPGQPDWRLVGRMLMAASRYE